MDKERDNTGVFTAEQQLNARLNVGEHVPRKLEWKLAKGIARIPRKWLVVAWADEKTPDWRAKNRREASYVANLFG